jgi:hypothetical protein
MKPLEGLLQRKGKAPELVTVYKMEMMLLNGGVDEELFLLYSAADGVPALLVSSTRERIAFGRGHAGHQWHHPGVPFRTYQMLKDIIDGWTPLKFGWTFEIEGNGNVFRDITIRDTSSPDKEIRQWRMDDVAQRAYELEVASWIMPDCLGPII